MNIWVDADACPSVVKEIILKAVLKRGIQTVFVANKGLFLPESPYLSLVRVAQGSDVADQYIAEHAEAADIIITQDIPLAAILVPKGAAVISPHGTLFTPNNIGERLSIRNFMEDLRGAGTQTGGPRPFSDKDKQNFANTFDQQLTKRFSS